MEFIDEIIDDKPVFYTILGLTIIFAGIFIVDSYNAINYVDPEVFPEIIIEQNSYSNYIGLFKLGLAPSAESRLPGENDIDTKIKLKAGDDVYSLYESRTWKTGDYGKSFAVKIN